MNAMTLVSWAVCGLIVGLIARFLVPGRQRIGLLMTMVLGILGAFAGGFIYRLFAGDSGAAFSLSGDAWHGWIVSILGAALLLWAFPLLQPRRWWQ